MAILGNIRKRTGLTIVVIGFAMVAFLVVDAFSKNSFLFGGADPSNLGKINGEKVSYNEYQDYQRSLSGRNLPQNQVNQQAWTQMVRNKLISQRADELGLSFPPFQAEAIMYDERTPEDAMNFIADLQEKAKAGDQAANNQLQVWKNFRDQMTSSIKEQQYLAILNAGTLPTSLDAKLMAVDNSSEAVIEYAFAAYQNLEKDNKIEVSDDEISAYIKKYDKLYQRPAMANLNIVTFPTEPSAEDDSAALNQVRAFLNDQVSKENDTIKAFSRAINDSAYITDHSDEPFNSTYQGYSSFASNKELQNLITTASPGTISKPYKNKNAYTISKFIGKEAVDSVNTSHILLRFVEDSLATENSTVRTRTEATALADSLNAVLQQEPVKFVNLAREFSEDGSAQQGGVIGWMTKDSPLVQPYKDFGFNNPKGAIGIAESQFGLHIINVTDKKTGTGYKVANLTKNVEISEKTNEDLHKKVNDFYAEVQGKSVNDFANLANEKSYAYTSNDNVERFTAQLAYGQISQVESILSWAFNEDVKPGNVRLFNISNGGRAVVYLQSKSKKGLASASSVRKEVEPILKRQKALDAIQAKANNLNMEQFVSQYGAIKSTATVKLGTPTLDSKGPEPAVVGAAFGLNQNEASGLIKGNGGLYMVKTISKTKTDAPNNVDSQKTQLQSQYNSLGSRIVQSMVESADITDNRSKFFTSSSDSENN